jgi:hypothetical protein
MTHILKDIKSYETELNGIKQELKKLPEGSLVRHGSTYYIRVNGVDKGITRNLTLLRQLARKAYLLRRFKHLEANLTSARQPGSYQTEDFYEIVHGLSSVYQTLPLEYFFHPSLYKKLAENEKAQQNPYHSEGLIFHTGSGLRVRSKSERTIADTLDQYKIPFNYEAAIVLDRVVLHPDFTVYRPDDGKLLLWEHFGIMDDNNYRKNAIEKIAVYIRNGYYPSSNLICTYEPDMHNPAHIQKIIESFILRTY